jgi:hypothetical protein
MRACPRYVDYCSARAYCSELIAALEYRSSISVSCPRVLARVRTASVARLRYICGVRPRPYRTHAQVHIGAGELARRQPLLKPLRTPCICAGPHKSRPAGEAAAAAGGGGRGGGVRGVGRGRGGGDAAAAAGWPRRRARG